MKIKNFAGKCVVITGAASGIGHETAVEFAKAGAFVAAIDINDELLAATKERIEKLGQSCLTVICDVSDEASVSKAVTTITGTYGTPHVVINNAGVGFWGPFLDTPLNAWERVFNINVKGTVILTRAFLPAMIDAGDSRRIINIASAAAIHPVANLSAYSASKHAVLGLSDTLAMELQGKNVNITTVCPGIINTPIVRNRANVAESVPDAAVDRVEAQYVAKGVHPSVVAKRIVKAARNGDDLVLVGPTAAAVFHTRRISRSLLRQASLSGAKDLGYVW